MHIETYIGLVVDSETVLGDAYTNVARRHEDDAGIRDGCHKMAGFAKQRIRAANSLRKKNGSSAPPRMVRDALFHDLRVGGIGVIRDLHDLGLLAHQSMLYWTALYQGYRALHQMDAESICRTSIEDVASVATQNRPCMATSKPAI